MKLFNRLWNFQTFTTRSRALFDIWQRSVAIPGTSPINAGEDPLKALNAPRGTSFAQSRHEKAPQDQNLARLSGINLATDYFVAASYISRT
jgi:hypothetical protein